jgi:hypothetical protein
MFKQSVRFHNIIYIQITKYNIYECLVWSENTVSIIRYFHKITWETIREKIVHFHKKITLHSIKSLNTIQVLCHLWLKIRLKPSIQHGLYHIIIQYFRLVHQIFFHFSPVAKYYIPYNTPPTVLASTSVSKNILSLILFIG